MSVNTCTIYSQFILHTVNNYVHNKVMIQTFEVGVMYESAVFLVIKQEAYGPQRAPQKTVQIIEKHMIIIM